MPTNAKFDTDFPSLLGAWFAMALLWGVGCLNHLDRSILTTMRDSVKPAIPMRDDAQTKQRATGYGFLDLFGCCIGGLASYLGGCLKERDFDLSYLPMGSALGVFMSALLLVFVNPFREGIIA